jgi:hypothetical protein
MVSRYTCFVSIQNCVADIYSTDAQIFYNLETWVATRKDPSSTRYPSQFELFQRHMTTVAYKIAAEADLPASSLKASKQSSILKYSLQRLRGHSLMRYMRSWMGSYCLHHISKRGKSDPAIYCLARSFTTVTEACQFIKIIVDIVNC